MHGETALNTHWGPQFKVTFLFFLVHFQKIHVSSTFRVLKPRIFMNFERKKLIEMLFENVFF